MSPLNQGFTVHTAAHTGLNKNQASSINKNSTPFSELMYFTGDIQLSAEQTNLYYWKSQDIGSSGYKMSQK
jgi:hypothetical protein